MSKTTNFDTALKLFVRGVTGTKTAARACAELSLAYYVEHGDTSQIQKFYDAVQKNAKNFVRLGAYLMWLRDFSHVRLEGGKFTKDTAKAEKKTPEQWAALAEQAKEKPFWDYAPEKVAIDWDAEGLLGQVFKLITKHENTERFKAAGPEATATLADLKAKVVEVAAARKITLAKAA